MTLAHDERDQTEGGILVQTSRQAPFTNERVGWIRILYRQTMMIIKLKQSSS
jgi:hypothetical protein